MSVESARLYANNLDLTPHRKNMSTPHHHKWGCSSFLLCIPCRLIAYIHFYNHFPGKPWLASSPQYYFTTCSRTERLEISGTSFYRPDVLRVTQSQCQNTKGTKALTSSLFHPSPDSWQKYSVQLQWKKLTHFCRQQQQRTLPIY